MTGKAATAKDMLDLLRRHYLPENRPAAGIFAPEIAAPGSNRRADLIFQGCTSAAGMELIGHEVKVTRADLAVELADLTKSHQWQRYCNRWFLVVPDESLIDGLDLPETWGVLTPPSGRRTRSMTITRRAPKLNPDEQARALRTLATWLHWRLEKSAGEVKQARDARSRADERARDAEARVPRGSERRSRQHELVDEIVRRLGGPHQLHADRIGGFNASVSVDDVVAALQDIGTARDRIGFDYRALSRSAQDLQRLLADVDRGKLAKLALDVEQATQAAS